LSYFEEKGERTQGILKIDQPDARLTCSAGNLKKVQFKTGLRGLG
jgi:hypothetical protein